MMYNLIGGVPESYKQAPPENATLHDYLKEPRPGRKAGHLTLQLDAAEDYQDKLDLLNKIEAAAS